MSRCDCPIELPSGLVEHREDCPVGEEERTAPLPGQEPLINADAGPDLEGRPEGPWSDAKFDAATIFIRLPEGQRGAQYHSTLEAVGEAVQAVLKASGAPGWEVEIRGSDWLDEVAKTIIDGLQIDGAHHKQHFLVKIAEGLSIDTSGIVYDEGVPA